MELAPEYLPLSLCKVDGRGWTALHAAASAHYQEGVESLLEQGSDLHVQSYSGNTPLHEGINNCKIVKTLLDKGALPNCRNGKGETPLFLAVRHRNEQVVNLLLTAGANIDIQNEFGETALRLAVSNHAHEIIMILLDHGANKNAQCKLGLAPLHIAAKVNDCLTTEMLIDMGANPNITDKCDEYLEATFGNTPLHIATNNKFSSVVRVLLDGGANADIKNSSGYTPLHASVCAGDFQSVQLLLEKGADVNLKETYQENASLHLAAKSSEPLMINTLMQGGAIVDSINIKENTALHEAVNSMVPKNVKCFLTGGVLLEEVNSKVPENVICLLYNGANVNAQNIAGNSPLHLAVSRKDFRSLEIVGTTGVRSLEVTQILLAWGASVTLPNNKSETVLDVADSVHLDLIKKHFVKLCPLNGSQFKLNVPIDLRGYKSFHISCLEELERLKMKKCGIYSLFDIFSNYDIPFYVNAISLEKALCCPLQTEFPIYALLLQQTFLRAKKRFCVMQKLVECFNLRCLPAELKWKILTYLSDENLEYILKIVETH